MRSTCMDEDAVKSSFLSFDSKKQRASALLSANSLLDVQHEAWSTACQIPTTVSSILDGQPPQLEPNADMLVQADSSRTGAALLLHAAAASAVFDLKLQHELEGKLLTSSMMQASDSTAADIHFSRHQLSPDLHTLKAEAGQGSGRDQPASFASACASLWAPLQSNKAADQLFESRRWSKDELTYQDVRSPRRYALCCCS